MRIKKYFRERHNLSLKYVSNRRCRVGLGWNLEFESEAKKDNILERGRDAVNDGDVKQEGPNNFKCSKVYKIYDFRHKSFYLPENASFVQI